VVFEIFPEFRRDCKKVAGVCNLLTTRYVLTALPGRPFA